ncbi:MAG TPA: DUF5916 domain-containing protein [Candidatus Elarobacter sp.]
MIAAVALAAALTAGHAQTPPALDGEAGWNDAPAVTLGWDFTNGRPAPQETRVRVLVDDKYLYVRFDAKQREPIAATQTVDDNGQGSDDDVHVSLWPSGSNGFEYQFDANPRGTHYQSSTENTTYAPTWTSVGRTVPGGYVVTMRIPLKAMRSDGRATWIAQFTRYIKETRETDEWAYAPGQGGTDVVTFAGRIDGMSGSAKATRTAPRIGVYALAQAGTGATGGSTSRMGSDISLPLTPTASFVATIHPDFSNVEKDQQTIAPTTFRRQFSEVRPFFAQGANFYDYNNCYGCPGATELYTPAIPTPKRGYQLEGKQGQFTFGALDAVGDRRTDNAQSLAYATPDRTYQINYTRVASEQPGVHDVVDYGFIGYSDHKRYSAYFEKGFEHGTFVTDGYQATRYDAGAAYSTKDDFWSVSVKHVGAQYAPVDGYVAVGDIAGYSAQGSHTWRFKDAAIQSVSAFGYVERYAGSDGFGTNLYDASAGGSFFLRNKLSASGSIGSSYYRLPGDPALHANNQEGLRLDYQLNTAQQSTLSWNGGTFGDGYLATWQEQLGFRIARRATISLFAYETNWHGRGDRAVQWLQRGSVTFDLGPRASLVAGVRKIVGTAPPFPGIGSSFTQATNVSLGFSARRPHDDLYVVYGDASALRTAPALIVKLVHYFGAEKGT